MASRWGLLCIWISVVLSSMQKGGGSQDNISLLALVTNSTLGIDITFSQLDSTHSTWQLPANTSISFQKVYLSPECGFVPCKVLILRNDVKSDSETGWYVLFVPVYTGVLILELEYTYTNFTVNDFFLVNSNSPSRYHPLQMIITADQTIYTACILDGHALTFLQLGLDNLSSIHEAFLYGYNKDTGYVVLSGGLQLSNLIVLDRQDLEDSLHLVLFGTGDTLNWYQFHLDGQFDSMMLSACEHRVIERIETINMYETILLYAYCGDTYTIYDIVNEDVLATHNNTYPVTCMYNNTFEQQVNISRSNNLEFIVETQQDHDNKAHTLRGHNILSQTAQCFGQGDNTYLAYVDKQRGTYITKISSDYFHELTQHGCSNVTQSLPTLPCPVLEVFNDRFVVVKESPSHSDVVRMYVYDTKQGVRKLGINLVDHSIRVEDITFIFYAETDPVHQRGKKINVVIVATSSGAALLVVLICFGFLAAVGRKMYKRRSRCEKSIEEEGGENDTSPLIHPAGPTAVNVTGQNSQPLASVSDEDGNQDGESSLERSDRGESDGEGTITELEPVEETNHNQGQCNTNKLVH